MSAEALGTAVHVSARTLLAYETGARQPDRAEVVDGLDAVLETGGLLRELYDDAMTERTLGATARAQPSGASAGGDDVRRRELLGLLGSATLLGPVADRLEELRRGTDDVLDSPATERDVAEWERVAWDYSCAVGTLPGIGLLSDLAADFAEIDHHARNASGQIRTRLLHVVGQLAALTAIALVGAGDHRTARRWWRTAARAADHAGDPSLAAIVRGRQAVLALYDTRPIPSVISLAEEGIAVGQGAPRAGVMSSHATIAQARADLGQHSRALDSLHDLESLFERLPDEVTRERDSQWGWTETRLRHVQSYVYTRAGDLPRASAAQDRALALYPGYSYQGRTQVQMHRAATVIVAGDPIEGVRYAVQVLRELPEDHRTDALIIQSAQDALHLVPPAMGAKPVVQEARELLGTAGADA